jgi:hypothetical protein
MSKFQMDLEYNEEFDIFLYKFHPRRTLCLPPSFACSAQAVPSRKLAKHRSAASIASTVRRWRYPHDPDGGEPAYKLDQGESSAKTHNLDSYRRRYNRAVRRAAKLFLSTYTPES